MDPRTPRALSDRQRREGGSAPGARPEQPMREPVLALYRAEVRARSPRPRLARSPAPPCTGPSGVNQRRRNSAKSENPACPCNNFPYIHVVWVWEGGLDGSTPSGIRLRWSPWGPLVKPMSIAPSVCGRQAALFLFGRIGGRAGSDVAGVGTPVRCREAVATIGEFSNVCFRYGPPVRRAQTAAI